MIEGLSFHPKEILVEGNEERKTRKREERAEIYAVEPHIWKEEEILNSSGRISLMKKRNTCFTEVGGDINRKLKIQRNSE